MQIDLGAVERLAFGGVVERAHHLFGGARRIVLADHLEQVAAMVDLHAQAQFDLAQVFVERATEIRQPGVVFRVEGEVALIEAVGHRKCALQMSMHHVDVGRAMRHVAESARHLSDDAEAVALP